MTVSVKWIAAAFFGLTLAACAPFDHQHDGSGYDPKNLKELTVVLGKQKINDILADEKLVIAALQEFIETGAEENTSDYQFYKRRQGYKDQKSPVVPLLELLENAGQGDSRAFPVQRGIGGGDAAAFLRAVRLKIDADGVFDEQIEVLVKVRGTTHHYEFNKAHGSGYIENEVFYDFLKNGKLVHQEKYYWTIGVRPGTYEVHLHSGEDNNPFPTVPMEFDKDMLENIKLRDLKYKLFAKGEGIVVLGVRKDDVLLPRSDDLYQSTSESCIDWMFKNHPPAHYGGLPRIFERCLGRCDHPALMNTGT